VLLTLAASSVASLLRPRKSGPAQLELMDLPRFAREDLGLHGLALSTELLKGVHRDSLMELRDRADKVGCACLLLADPNPLPFGAPEEQQANAAIERTERVLSAASLLGCNSAAIVVGAKNDDEHLDHAAMNLRQSIRVAERLELNLLITPAKGLTKDPDRVTDLIKRVGGFRLGTYPDFETAAASDDGVRYLRRLVPYASIVCASTGRFIDEATGKTAGTDLAKPVKHQPYELAPFVDAVESVGYQGTLALDYRGPGDPTVGLHRSRAALEQILGMEGNQGR